VAPEIMGGSITLERKSN